MARILDGIVAKATGNRFIHSDPVDLISAKLIVNEDISYYTEYFMGVELGQAVRVSDEAGKEHALRIIRNGLKDIIFGEFRIPLINAQVQLYNRDFEGAKKEIEAIERKMFYE